MKIMFVLVQKVGIKQERCEKYLKFHLLSARVLARRKYVSDNNHGKVC